MVTLNVQDYPQILSQQIHSLSKHENLCDLRFVSMDGELSTQKTTLFYAFPFLKDLVSNSCGTPSLHEEVTIFLPDVFQSDLENGLEQFYLHGDTEALAAVLDAFVTNGQEHENTEDDNDLALEEDKCDEQSIDDFSDLYDKDQFEVEHEDNNYVDEPDNSEYNNYSDELKDSTQSEFSKLITSTGVKKNQFKSFSDDSIATLGSCFFSSVAAETTFETQV